MRGNERLAMLMYGAAGGSHFQPLPWNLRMKVALEAARGLAFLHSDQAKVIYRDFKTSNILLDSVSEHADWFTYAICASQIRFDLNVCFCPLAAHRTTMQNSLILDWQKMVLVVTKAMSQPGSWGHKDMLPLNISRQVIFAT